MAVKMEVENKEFDKDLYWKLQQVKLRCEYIINMCHNEKEMILEAQAILKLLEVDRK